MLQSGRDRGRRLIHASTTTLGLLATLHPGATLLEGAVEGACVVLTVRNRLVVMAARRTSILGVCQVVGTLVVEFST